MTKRGAAILAAYSELDPKERKEVETELQRFENQPLEKRATVKRSWNESYGVTLGPVSNVCAYCGK